jgi:phospholipid/cholesterol/gamma-HCH transport system substrate-binding protein
MNTHRHVLLGLFFVSVIALLAWFTLFKTDFSMLSERQQLSVRFDDAGGLRQGDSVLVAGVRWGRVESLSFDPSAGPGERVQVALSLDRPVDLYADHAIRIENATVLGGMQLYIEPGSVPSGTLDPGTPLHGKVVPDVLKALGMVVSDNRQNLTNMITGLDEIVGEVRGGKGILSRLLYDEALGEDLVKTVKSLNETFINLTAISGDLRDGRGTLGRLLQDDALYNSIQTLATEITRVVEDVRAGKGIVGALLYDEDLADDFRSGVADLSDIVRRVNAGEGTLGMLISDDKIGRNLERITTDLAEGRGTLGKLLSDDEIYTNLRVISEDLSLASAALREGHGTLSRLIYEDELYMEMERALHTLTGTLEEAREAAPINTFLNTLFLGF